MLQEKMLFLDADSTVMAVSKPLEILEVLINNRRFLPISANGVFYEEILAGNNSFFVKRKAKMSSQGKAMPYGGYSQTMSATSYGNWQGSEGTSVTLKPNEKFKLETETSYYLKFGKSYKRFYSYKTLGKLFKGYESEIDKFANEQSIDFKKVEDVARIVEYGYSLTSNP